MNRVFSGVGIIVLGIAEIVSLASPAAAQRPGPPPPPPGPAGRRPPAPLPPPQILDRVRVADQINRTRYGLARAQPTGNAEKEIFSEANACLKHAQEHLASAQLFPADRLAGAAGALADAMDRLQHRSDAPGPPLPPGKDIGGYLVQVYFRVRQADYFSQQSHDTGSNSNARSS